MGGTIPYLTSLLLTLSTYHNKRIVLRAAGDEQDLVFEHGGFQIQTSK